MSSFSSSFMHKKYDVKNRNIFLQNTCRETHAANTHKFPKYIHLEYLIKLITPLFRQKYVFKQRISQTIHRARNNRSRQFR